MEKVYQISKDYSNDVANFKDWFGADMTQVKNSELTFNMITALIRKIRMTPGLAEQIDIMNDLEEVGLRVEIFNIINVKPFGLSIPWQGRYRVAPFKPGIDKIFDPKIPPRGCFLNVTLFGHPTSNVKWISPDVVVTVAEKDRRDFPVEEDTFIPEGAWLATGDQVVMFDNRFNDEHLFFVQIGFDGNPSYEEVVEKLKKLA